MGPLLASKNARPVVMGGALKPSAPLSSWNNSFCRAAAGQSYISMTYWHVDAKENHSWDVGAVYNMQLYLCKE